MSHLAGGFDVFVRHVREHVYESSGAVLWATEVRDWSSNITSCSVFDFENDGAPEVVYADEMFIRVYNGADGTVLLEERAGSGTLLEMPIVADVDNDNNAELLVVPNTYFGASQTNELKVYQDRNDTWVNTRKLWNQHSYHITNIEDDLTVPAVEANNWHSLRRGSA